MLHGLLQKLGLSKKEVEVYSALLEYGKTTPARLSKATNINRSTVYVVLEKLKEKRLIIEDISTKTLYFSPSSPEEVEDMFYHQQEELKKKKKIAAKLAEELEIFPKSKKYSVPKIRFVEEGDVGDFLYEQIDKWDKSSKAIDHACWGFQDKSFVKQYQPWIKWVSGKYRMKINLVSNKSNLEEKLKKEYAHERNIKYWNDELDFSASTWVMGDYLMMIITRQKPFYLVEIHDGVLAHNMRQVFKKIWNDIK